MQLDYWICHQLLGCLKCSIVSIPSIRQDAAWFGVFIVLSQISTKVITTLILAGRHTINIRISFEIINLDLFKMLNTLAQIAIIDLRIYVYFIKPIITICLADHLLSWYFMIANLFSYRRVCCQIQIVSLKLLEKLMNRLQFAVKNLCFLFFHYFNIELLQFCRNQGPIVFFCLFWISIFQIS